MADFFNASGMDRQSAFAVPNTVAPSPTELGGWDMMGRYDSDDSSMAGNTSDDCTPGEEFRGDSY